ncbi:MAG: hypothetical protein CL607_17530 [Anaerolineaceae bacterium]|nr:hypothetical protein [Anaerolineaceae bacterium]
MIGWDWLTDYDYDWRFILRVIAKAALAFIVINLLFAVCNLTWWVNQISIYNGLVPGRERLPYGEQAEAYNLTLDSLDAMFSTHVINRPKAENEFRVVVIGDSSVWGVLLDPGQTLAGQMNALDLQMADYHYEFYNLGYPTLSVLKDLLILERAVQYQPDLVLWLITPESLHRPSLLDAPLVQRNADATRTLIERYGLAIDPNDTRFVPELDFFGRTMVGQRRELADWWRLQLYGFDWGMTGIDHVNAPYDPLTNDFSEDVSWHGLSPGDDLQSQLALDVLDAGRAITEQAGVPLYVVNEPIYIADGENSDLHYNIWYPNWAYDTYQGIMSENATRFSDAYSSPWDMILPEHFTDSPVHMDPEGTAQFAGALSGAMMGVLFP